MQKQRYREMILADSNADLINDSSMSNNLGDNSNIDLTLFDLDAIKAATNNFSITKKLGQGSFGPVYKVNVHHIYILHNYGPKLKA